MKPIVDDELMERLSMLAKLELSEGQKEVAKKDLAEMLDYIDSLEKVDVSEVRPLYHVLPMENVFREDTVMKNAVIEARERNGRQGNLGSEQEEDWLGVNAPVMRDGFFVVPRTIGEAGANGNQ